MLQHANKGAKRIPQGLAASMPLTEEGLTLNSMLLPSFTASQLQR